MNFVGAAAYCLLNASSRFASMPLTAVVSVAIATSVRLSERRSAHYSRDFRFGHQQIRRMLHPVRRRFLPGPRKRDAGELPESTKGRLRGIETETKVFLCVEGALILLLN